MKLCRRLGATTPVTDFCTSPFMPEGGSDEELLAHIEKSRYGLASLVLTITASETLYHPMCTCKIGPKDKGGVVDPQLRLYGVSNVRVCDASVFPEAVSGHPVSYSWRRDALADLGSKPPWLPSRRNCLIC